MKELRLALVSLLVITKIACSFQKQTLLPSYDICRLFPNGTKLRKPGTCDEGIVCENFVSTPGIKCEQQWYSLDLTTSACVTKQPSDRYCKSPCLSSSPKFVIDKKNCSNWYRCDGKKEMTKGSCPTNQFFSQQKQACSYEMPDNCHSAYGFCDVVPENIPFQDEENCHQYYICGKSGTLESFTCPTHMYFDRSLGKCIAKSQAECFKHPYPENVCGSRKFAYRNRFVSDQATCRGYFYCKDMGVGVPDIRPIWGQCSVDEFFNAAEQSCMKRNSVKCYEDRCQSRSEGDLEISTREGCQHFLKCGNGYTIEEIYCGDGMYFDLEKEICTTVQKSYPSCALGKY